MNATKVSLLCSGLLLLAGCHIHKNAATVKKHAPEYSFTIEQDSLALFDATRARPVPVALYFPTLSPAMTRQGVVIFSHGYGANKGGANRQYSYLTEHLAAQGYFVASIQHELPDDELLPMTGNPRETRRPNWERGVANILFVLNELKRRKPGLDYPHLTLIGHSNGGDMTMLFAQKYPTLVYKAISLDNRRMPLPRSRQPKVYSLRSGDQPADEGVLPAAGEQKKFGMKIIRLDDTKHNDMDDDANERQRKEICNYVLGFLNEP